MAKKVIPNKVIIEFADGKFLGGIILYKINDNGAVGKIKSLGIKGANFSKPTLNGLLDKFIKHVEKSEAIDELS